METTTTTNPIINAALRCSLTKDDLVYYIETTDLPPWSQCLLTAHMHTLAGALLLTSQMDCSSQDDVRGIVAYLNSVEREARDALDSLQA